ncbi:MAG: hypothetical protein IRZ31_20990 [Thermogemmatispora sp.]|uniref:hypothetical protein n=1 Tax=Thermogemmatispora sp. TaxID=1968838 RepID=UPI00263A1D29|nr:hypothetical protein [Thermogemmatispora sp.]MBX5459375.1 hypothetical protein [Thermogemmatispora sp.]
MMEEEGKLIKKSLWLFEYNRGDSALYLQQFYAVDENDVRRQIEEFIRRVDFPVYWERLRHVPGGFTIGYSSLKGIIYERPDGSLIEEVEEKAPPQSSGTAAKAPASGESTPETASGPASEAAPG